MKKTLSVFVVALLLSSSMSYAQSQPVPEKQEKKASFWYGPKVGVDLVTATIDQAEIESQINSNYSAGFFLQFGRTLYIQPEFYYVMNKESVTFEGQTSATEVTVNTLRIPLMLGLRVINLGIVSAHIMGGPSATFFLNESDPDPLNPRPTSSFALQAGGGVDVLGFITLDVRYSVDLNESLETQIEHLTWDSGINVTLGIKLR